MIIVDADGELITYTNGDISSDNPELVRIVKEQAAIGMEIQFIQPFGDYFRASLDPEDLIGITAALFSAKPGRTRLLEAPDEVWEKMQAEQAVGGCGYRSSPERDSDFESLEAMERALARILFGDLDDEKPRR
jgi:hypothetical protein